MCLDFKINAEMNYTNQNNPFALLTMGQERTSNCVRVPAWASLKLPLLQGIVYLIRNTSKTVE